jgi:endonuclease/exonuclease/phosphatase (EEP) superfamily protein YafD
MRIAKQRFAVRLYSVAAAATIIASLLACLARYAWAAELLSHFRLQYLIAALGLLLLQPKRGRVRWLLLLAIVLNGWPLAPYRPDFGRATTFAQSPITLLNANVRAGVGQAAALLKLVAEEQPDLVLVIELTESMAADLTVIETTHPYQLLAPGSGNFGAGLYSRLPLQATEILRLGSITALKAVVATESGLFALIGLHLTPPVSPALAAERNTQLAALARIPRAADQPRLACGDFNSTPYSPWFRQFEADSGLRDLRRGHWPGMSWPAYFPPAGIAIDHCLADPELTALSVRKLDNIGSDHYPQLFEILLEPDR